MALVLTRKVGENLIVRVGGHEGKISIRLVDRNYVKLAFEGDIEVVRQEIDHVYKNRKRAPA